MADCMGIDDIRTTIYLRNFRHPHQAVHLIFLQEDILHEENCQGREYSELFRHNVVHRVVFHYTLPSTTHLSQLGSKPERRKGHQLICHIYINIYNKYSSGHCNSYNAIVRNLDAAYAARSEMAC